MKQKSKKAAQKRFTITSKGKVLRRHVNQAHFNSRDTGDDTRSKRGKLPVHTTDRGRLKQLLPYHQ